jgi:uncharacterized protein (DUF4415 family)
VGDNNALRADRDFNDGLDGWMSSVRNDLRDFENAKGAPYTPRAADTASVDKIIEGLKDAGAFNISALVTKKFQDTPGWQDRMQDIARDAATRAGLWSKTGTFHPATEQDAVRSVILESSDAGRTFDGLLLGSPRWDVSPTMGHLWERLSQTYADSLRDHVTVYANKGIVDSSVFFTTEWPRIRDNIRAGRMSGMTIKILKYDDDGLNPVVEGEYHVSSQAQFDAVPRVHVGEVWDKDWDPSWWDKDVWS